MTNTIKVKIIMPSNTLFEAKATMVNIPGGEGMFGVLPGHMKLISTIQIGIVSIFIGEVEKKFFIYGGLAQITPTEVNIVTEFAYEVNAQSRSEILNKMNDLKSELEVIEKNSIEYLVINDNISKYSALLNFMI